MGVPVLVAACAASPSSPFDEPVSPPVVTTPRSRAAIASLPREDWPCGADTMLGEQMWESTIAYDGPTACLMPIDLAVYGNVGCPTAVVRRDLAGTRTTRHESFHYDVRGRLLQAQVDGMTYQYTWDGDLLTGRTWTLAGKARSERYVDTGDALELQGEDGAIIFHFESGSVTSFEQPSARGVLRWSDGRLVAAEVNQVQLTKPVYDCER